ncbi:MULTISPECIES: CBS domain-containing protein [unclassified Streptomyces]|uniref:CBS domain-containing protein n=1 Tax=unclassified Streptomyces TaxID=2593676 RepID=UPI001F0439F4|nr:MULTISPECIES: CBS domain-containing protein [unclassified Streptomyces]MCH0565734.1 CBS domain-containing protein [Streptomyces sp. MUM 2J]MCH0570585.1 CBS domain-containing protein [Streptomyces sp. MUM 136J]
MNERESHSAASEARHGGPGRRPRPSGEPHEDLLLRYLSAMSALSSRQTAARAPGGHAAAGPPERAAEPAPGGPPPAPDLGPAGAPVLVRDVMQVPAPSVAWDLAFQEVARVLARERTGSVAVVDEDDRVLGVVSESDLLAKAAVEASQERPGAMRRIRGHRILEKASGDTAEALMTSPAITVLPGATAAEAAWLVALSRLKRVPVTDHQGRLVGTVDRTALLQALIRDDSGLEKEVRRLVTVVAGPGAADDVHVAVHAGVVDLRGRLPGAAAERLLAEIRGLEDVAEVHADLGSA